MRLKTSSMRLIDASVPSSASVGEASASPARRATSSAEPLCTSALMATKITTRTSVTTGPATAILNSAPGDVVSRAIFATPPNSQRSMPLISMPSRRATSAWPSSCMTSETKNRNTAVTATTYACVTEPPSTSRK